MKIERYKKIFLACSLSSGLTFAQAFADSIDFDFYVNDPSIKITFNQIQPFNSSYTSSAQANTELLYPVNFNGQMTPSTTLASSFAKNYPNHLGLNTKDSNPDAVDVNVKINMSINGSPVLAAHTNDAIVLAHEHKDHNWFIAASAGTYNTTVFQGSNTDHSDWGLNISTQDGNQYCLKAVNIDYAAVLYRGQCNNNANYSASDIGANSSGRYDFSAAEISTFSFSSAAGISKVDFTYNGTHNGIYCISGCNDYTTAPMTEQFINIYNTTSGNNLNVNILANLRSSVGDGTNYVPVGSFNHTFSPDSQQFSLQTDYSNSRNGPYPGLQAGYFVVEGNLAITDSNNNTTTFPVSLAYSRYNFGWNIGSAMGSSIHNKTMTLTNNSVSYCLSSNDSKGDSASVSPGVCPAN